MIPSTDLISRTSSSISFLFFGNARLAILCKSFRVTVLPLTELKALLPCVATFCSDSHAVKDRFFGVGGLGVQVRRDIFLVHLAPSYFFVILLSHVGKGNCCFAS